MSPECHEHATPVVVVELHPLQEVLLQSFHPGHTRLVNVGDNPAPVVVTLVGDVVGGVLVPPKLDYLLAAGLEVLLVYHRQKLLPLLLARFPRHPLSRCRPDGILQCPGVAVLVHRLL